ncbi:MAG: succinate dehydrogenase assembly factor 4 [Pseudomonadota bacterium]
MTTKREPQPELPDDVPSPSDAVAPQTAAGAPDGRAPQSAATEQPVEIGGPEGPEPTRYGDWERKGRCIDF